MIVFLQFSSVQFSHSVMSDSLQPHGSQHARPPYPSPTPGVHSNSRPSSRWCHPAISSSVVPFSSCPVNLILWRFIWVVCLSSLSLCIARQCAFHGMDVPQFNHSLLRWVGVFSPSFWILWKLLKHLCTDFCVNISFDFSLISAQKYKCWTMRYLHVSFYMELPDCFLEWLCHFIIHFYQQCWVVTFLHVLTSIWIL